MAAAIVLSAGAGQAQQENIAPLAEFMFQGAQISILRDTSLAAHHVAQFTGDATACEDTCLGPVQLDAGVKTLGAREVIDFLMGPVANNTGLLVDARMPQARNIGYIPASVSLPHATMQAENGYRDDILSVLGAQRTADGFTFDGARTLLVFDAGPVADDAAVLVGHLLTAGYPAEKINYYHGGMLMWSALGLSVQAGPGS